MLWSLSFKSGLRKIQEPDVEKVGLAALQRFTGESAFPPVPVPVSVIGRWWYPQFADEKSVVERDYG